MHIVVRFSALTAALCACLIVLASVAGSAQPPAPQLAALHLDQCALPCWLNIQPGVTPFEEAVEKVRAAHPSGLLTSGYGTAVTAAYLLGSPMGQVGIYSDAHGTVLQLTLLTHSVQGVRLGDVVSFLGTPTCTIRSPEAFIYASSGAFAVLYPSHGASRWRVALDHVEIRPITADQSPCATLIN